MNNGNKMPKVSVRLPSYNHEKYIRECLDSILNQTFQDFEVVITDDGSTDGTVDVIKKYQDPRIYLVVFEQNRGSASAIENAASRACGEYVANICSDDVWEPDKLEKQVSFLDNNPGIGAVFTRVQCIDDDSRFIPDDTGWYTNIFNQPNRSRNEWLHYFFYSGNCLCIPSVLIRRSVYKKLCYQDKRMANLHDFDLWVRFCMQYDLYILDERLTKFRLRANNANASGDRIENQIRINFEYKQILNNFLKIENSEKLMAIFPECKEYGIPEDSLISYFLGRLAYDTGIDFKQQWGLEKIFELLNNGDIAKTVSRKYDFSYKDFYSLTESADVYKLKEIHQLQKEIFEINKTVDDKNNHIHNIEEQNKLFLNEIDQVHKTLSWKLTAPLRIILKIFRKKQYPGRV